MHLVDALTRMRLLTSGFGLGCCVPFTHHKIRMTLLKGEGALAARRDVASKLRDDPRTMSSLCRQDLIVDMPNFELMQRLFDAGIAECPLSGMRTFDPSQCTPTLRTALGRALNRVAAAVTTRELGQVDEALDELQEQLREHAAKKRRLRIESEEDVTDAGESSLERAANKRMRPRHRIAVSDEDDASD